jgi:iron-sulfur cluster repair protein YtfE (RIC family)
VRSEALEGEPMEHIHLENNVLFPRVLGAAA